MDCAWKAGAEARVKCEDVVLCGSVVGRGMMERVVLKALNFWVLDSLGAGIALEVKARTSPLPSTVLLTGCMVVKSKHFVSNTFGSDGCTSSDQANSFLQSGK